MKTAVAYIPTSTTRQNLGLDAQLAAITRFADAEGFEISQTFSEQESAATIIARSWIERLRLRRNSRRRSGR